MFQELPRRLAGLGVLLRNLVLVLGGCLGSFEQESNIITALGRRMWRLRQNLGRPPGEQLKQDKVAGASSEAVEVGKGKVWGKGLP